MNPRVFYIYDYRNPVSYDYVDFHKLACIVLANSMSDALSFFLDICGLHDGDSIEVRIAPSQGAINNLDANTDLCVHPDASRARIAEISFMKRMVEQSFQTWGKSWA